MRLLAMLALASITLGEAPRKLTEVQSLRLENLRLRSALLQQELQALHLEICADIPLKECLINPQTGFVSRTPQQPEK